MSNNNAIYRSALGIKAPEASWFLNCAPLVGANERRLTVEECRAALAACSSFGTLDDHADAILRQAAQVQAEHSRDAAKPPKLDRDLAEVYGRDVRALPAWKRYRAALTRLAGTGALVTRDKFVELLRKAHQGSTEKEGRIEWQVIPTNGRVACVRRCVASHAANYREFGKRVTIVIANDDHTAASDRKLRAECETARARLGARIDYIGLPEKRAIVQKLRVLKVAPAEVLSFALFGDKCASTTVGANRNVLLLHTHGHMVYSTDDDTLSEGVKSTQDDGAIALNCDGAPVDWWFERGALPTTAQPLDVLSLHETILGKSIREVASRLVPECVMEGRLCHRTAADLITGLGRVLVTHNGVDGDSGMQSGTPLLLVRGESRKRLLRTEQTLRKALSDRNSLRMGRRISIAHIRSGSSVSFGIDNRETLPPFQPSYIGEESTFLEVLKTMRPSGYSGYVPVGISHVPLSARTYASPECDNLVHPHMCTLLTTFLGQYREVCGLQSEEARARLYDLSDYLECIGSLDQHSFNRHARHVLTENAKGYLRLLEDVLAVHNGEPEFWATKIGALQNAIRHKIVSQDGWIPVDVAPGAGSEERAQLTRDFVRKYAQCCAHWPAIVDAYDRFEPRSDQQSAPPSVG